MLSHIETLSSGVLGFVCDDGTVGLGLELPTLDLEQEGAASRIAFMSQFLANIPENVVVRIVHDRKADYQLESEGLRIRSISDLGFIRTKNILLIEMPVFGFSFSLRKSLNRKNRHLEKMNELFNHIQSSGLLSELGARFLDEAELSQLFEAEPEGALSLSYLDDGTKLIGAIRVVRPGINQICESTLSNVLQSIGTPFVVATRIQRVSAVKAGIQLRSKLGRAKSGSEVGSHHKEQAAIGALERVDLSGEALFSIEWVLKIERASEAELKAAIVDIKRHLGNFGEVQVETVGLIQTLQAFVPGQVSHAAFYELGNGITHYLPIASSGESQSQSGAQIRTAHFHRSDWSVHAFDLFSKDFLAFNALITGATGSGKSVLTGLLSRCLFQDQAVHLIKIDVGGSYKHECEELGGLEIELDLNAQMGLDPFHWIKDSTDLEAVEVVSELVCSLLLETGESEIPKSIRSLVETRLRTFIGVSAEPSFDAFITECRKQKLPRVELLDRFGKAGLYCSLFSGNRSKEWLAARYLYFNFGNIVSAKSVDFSRAVMSAVIAFTNLKMLNLSKQGGRLVLICDETKFFLEKEARFFLLTTANFRKFGHSTILIGQNMRDFDQIAGGGLILNSPIRFFLSGDIDEDYLKTRFKLDPHHIGLITQGHIGRDYRECVLSDDTGTRGLKLKLTQTEGILLSSRKEDRDQYEGLKKMLPWMNQSQLVAVIGMTQNQAAS